ncbi:MAG: hypothetical protein D6763_08160 [Alphaproteobacteria bacterium]|nr:MAG: hypothetical protein D6763_08160 [Alphaproteobacteria bacterium]
MSKRERPGSYQMMVAADSADQAIDIAAEALPPGAELVDGVAVRTAKKEGDEWQVTIKFKGRRRRIPDPPGLSGSGSE